MSNEVTVTVNKGTRIRARWFKPQLNPPASLAGVQLKLSCSYVEVSGVVRHIRVDNQENPTDYQFFIDPDPEVSGAPLVSLEGCSCGRGHIHVDPKHVYEVG